MKIQITEDRDGEISEKAEELTKAIVERFSKLSPEVRDLAALLKARAETEVKLRYPTLKELQKRSAAVFQRQMSALLSDVEKVLDRSVDPAETQKSLDPSNFLDEFDKLPPGERDFILNELARKKFPIE